MSSIRHALGLAAILAAGFAGNAAAAANCGSPQYLPLPGIRGSGTSTVVERRDSVREDRVACYVMNIRGNARTLYIKLYTDDANGFIQLFAPDWRVVPAGQTYTFTGNALPGAAAADHAKGWKGSAPLGNILLVVDLSGPGRQYRLHVEAY